MTDPTDRSSENQFRALIQASSTVIYRMSPDWREMLSLEGVGFLADSTNPDESWMDRYIPAEDRPTVLAAIERAIHDRSAFDLEHRVVRVDGSVGWTHSRAIPMRDGSGEILEWLGAANDVTARRAAETALSESEKCLRLALAAAMMGTWTWDVATDSHHRDTNLNRLFGLPAVETTSPLAEFLDHIHPDDREFVHTAFDDSVRQGRLLNVEFRVVWPDGTIRWLLDQGDVFDTAGQTLMLGACADITNLKEAEASLQRSNDALEVRVKERTADLETEMERRRNLARQLGSAQEDERQRVARDLHDSAGQLLVGLSLAFKQVALALDLPASLVGKLSDAQKILDSLGRELHGLAVRLRPTSLDDFGLIPALGQLIEEWSDRSDVRADFQTLGIGPNRLTPEIETTIYRIVQEALTNIARYAQASLVSVVVNRPDGHVIVVVEDDGVGFDQASKPQGRLGLMGMRERVNLVGGELDIESSPGSGTSIFVRIPIPGCERSSGDQS